MIRDELIAELIGTHIDLYIDHVRLSGTSLYVYSERGRVDRHALIDVPTYIGRSIDVWCWHACQAYPSGFGRYYLDDSKHVLERHEFRVRDKYQRLADALFNESNEYSRISLRIVLRNQSALTVDEWAELARDPMVTGPDNWFYGKRMKMFMRDVA